MKSRILKYLPKLYKRDKVFDKCIIYQAIVDDRKFVATTKFKLIDELSKHYATKTFDSLTIVKITYESLIH